ncbi:MAG: hypothetical protein J6K84_02560 [Oscillospiraceae bacterium]|nr:hypothetical protein [Oscillospiraceae bacterium]
MNEYVYTPKEKSRVQQINESILQNVKTVYRLRKIQHALVDQKPCYAYVISLAKNHAQSLKEQTLSLYQCLKSILSSDETLTTEHKCFKIIAEGFEVTYCIEAWQKHADTTAYMENGEVVTELIHRMSCEQATYIFKKHRVDPFELLNTLETLQKYNHPAERYTALAKMPILLKETTARGE